MGRCRHPKRDLRTLLPDQLVASRPPSKSAASVPYCGLDRFHTAAASFPAQPPLFQHYFRRRRRLAMASVVVGQNPDRLSDVCRRLPTPSQ